MSAKGNFFESEILNATLRGQSTFLGATLTGKLSNVYVALSIGDPGEDGSGGAEPSGGNYARVAVPCQDSSWTSPSDDGSGNMQVSNAIDIAFPSPTANWGTVDYFKVMDAATNGNMLYKGALQTPRNILNGDTAPTFATGALTISEG